MSEEVSQAAETMYHDLSTGELAARIKFLEGELEHLKQALRDPVSRLYGCHPDDIYPQESNEIC